MTNPFEDLEQALVNASGMDNLIAGAILGILFTVPLIIMFVFILDPKGNNSMPAIMIGGTIGIAFSTVVGWFDLWVVAFIIIVIVFILTDPLGFMGKNRSSDT